jgi:ABC-type multidrug transport system fused ATPase/permease subunit
MYVLPRKDRVKLGLIAFLQILTGALDLLGVAAIGLLGTLLFNSFQLNQEFSNLDRVLKLLHLSGYSLGLQTVVVGSIALVILVSKTLLSVYFTRKTLFFLSIRGAQISANLISRLLSQPLLMVKKRSSQEILYAVTTGVSLLTLQVLAPAVIVISDLSLLLIMGIGLYVIDPITATGTFLIFAFVGYFLNRFTNTRARKLGELSSTLNIASNQKIVEVLGSYRELVVGNRRHYYERKIRDFRYSLANSSAELSFLPYVSKYAIELAVISGSLFVGLIAFISQDAVRAMSILTMFLAAGTRIAPAVLRVQQGFITIRGSLGQSQPTLDLIDSLKGIPSIENLDDKVKDKYEGFIPEIRASKVSFSYPDKSTPALSEISFNIQAGSTVALVGTSGAGKTTLIDVLLGIIHQDSGEVLISGLPPLEAIAKWPGAISYLPQDIVITTGSIRENVALGYPPQEATDESVFKALRVAHLDEFVLHLRDGLETQVGENGAKLSGGQRQRLGIARSMFTSPRLLVLDEATSSLDGGTEASVSKQIESLRGSITIIMIAHRLSTIKSADLVIYISEGKIAAMGSFDQVRAIVPEFDKQVQNSGI